MLLGGGDYSRNHGDSSHRNSSQDQGQGDGLHLRSKTVKSDASKVKCTMLLIMYLGLNRCSELYFRIKCFPFFQEAGKVYFCYTHLFINFAP